MMLVLARRRLNLSLGSSLASKVDSCSSQTPIVKNSAAVGRNEKEEDEPEARKCPTKVSKLSVQLNSTSGFTFLFSLMQSNTIDHLPQCEH